MWTLRLLALLGWLSWTDSQKGLGIFFVEEPRSQVVLPGSEVTLTCATNLQVDHLGWLRGWRPLEPGSDPDIDVQPGRIRIWISRDPDQYQRQVAEYRCMAWIAPIGLASLPASLRVVHTAPFEPRDNASITAPPGGSVSISCPPPESEPPVQLEFSRDGRPLDTTTDSHLTLLPGGRLVIADLTATYTGLYTCIARNSQTGRQVAAPFATRLDVRPTNTVQFPLLTVEPDKVHWAAAGETLRLPCVAAGWPVPAVTWRRSDGRWTARYRRRPGCLEIRGLRAADQGEFVCDAASAAGTVTAVTIVRITEPPSVETSPSDLSVLEGAEAALNCSGRGQPPPQLQWVLNGRPVLNQSQQQQQQQRRQPRVEGGVLRFEAVSRQDAGLYQCFGHSDAGHAKTAVLLKVIPKTTMSLEPAGPPRQTTPASPVSTVPRRDLGHRRNHARRKGNDAVMVPPDAPRVYPISESSVMLQWDVPPNSGLSILFFKVQYRRTPRRRHDWHTLDSDVPGTARSFEITGLKLGAKYKFRVLAVYENKDNKHSQNSRKVKITPMRKKARPPGAPVITMHRPQGATSISCSWTYYNLQAAPIEGYFIHYRDTTTAGDYSKVTVLGETTKTHVLTDLVPATSYEIKVQAFNRAGGVSEFSPIVTERTQAAPGVPAVPDADRRDGPPPVKVVSSRGLDGSRSRLYAAVGGSLGGLLLLAAVLALVCHCRASNAHKSRGPSDGCSDTCRQPDVLQPLSTQPGSQGADLTWPDLGTQPTSPASPRQMGASSETSFCRPEGPSPPLRTPPTRHAPSAALNNNTKHCAGGQAGQARRQHTDRGFESDWLRPSRPLDGR